MDSRIYTYCVVEDNRDSPFDYTMQRIRIVSEHDTPEAVRAVRDPCGQHIMQHIRGDGFDHYCFIGTNFTSAESAAQVTEELERDLS